MAEKTRLVRVEERLRIKIGRRIGVRPLPRVIYERNVRRELSPRDNPVNVVAIASHFPRAARVRDVT